MVSLVNSKALFYFDDCAHLIIINSIIFDFFPYTSFHISIQFLISSDNTVKEFWIAEF